MEKLEAKHASHCLWRLIKPWVVIVSTFCVVIYFLILLNPNFLNFIIKHVLIPVLEHVFKTDVGTYKSIVDKTEFFGTAIWTLTTIVFAVVCFYFSQMKEYRYGIQISDIISFKYGYLGISMMLVLNAIIVLTVTAAYFMDRLNVFYSLWILSVMMQIFVVVLCLLINNNNVCRKIIEAELKRRLKHSKGVTGDDADSADILISQIIHSECPDRDKFEFLFMLLQNTTSMAMNAKHADDLRESLCSYLYENLNLILEVANCANPFLKDDIWLKKMLRELIKGWNKKIKTIESDSKEKCCTSWAALLGTSFQVLLKRNYTGKWEIIKSCVKEIGEECNTAVRCILLLVMASILREDNNYSDILDEYKRNILDIYGSTPGDALKDISDSSNDGYIFDKDNFQINFAEACYTWINNCEVDNKSANIEEQTNVVLWVYKKVCSYYGNEETNGADYSEYETDAARKPEIEYFLINELIKSVCDYA